MASDNPLSYDTFNEKILDRGISTSQYALNGHLHEIQIFIFNGEQMYSVAPTAIVELNIEDTTANWITQGTLTIYNSNELMEYLRKYNFRNDGEDLLRVRIIPRDLNVRGLPSLNINTNRQLWEINELFSIYNIEDVTPQTQSNSDAKKYKKFKKFYFWDLRYQIMLTKNIEYSTALSPIAPINSTATTNDSDIATIATDENRSIPTGLAINEIIKVSLNNNPILAKTGLDVDASKYWDEGGRTLFYTSGASDNCFEDLEYIKSRHISSIFLESGVPDFCLFNTQRSNDGLSFFTLTPFSKIFNRAGSDQPGEDQIEHFYLHADAKEESQQGITSYRAPKSSNANSTRDITLRDFSFITSYELTDIIPTVNAADFVSYGIYSFDFAKRQYNVEFAKHNFVQAQKLFQEKYISQLYKNGKSGNDNFLLNVQNNAKINNYSVMPVFNNEGDSTKPEIRAISGLYRLLYTGLFQNTCINFTVPGLTLRQAGKFIGIDRPAGSLDNSLDDKLCGQWFVINVVHTIVNGAYYNNITAIKIHRHKPTTLAQRTTERVSNRFAPQTSLQNLLFSGSSFLNR